MHELSDKFTKARTVNQVSEAFVSKVAMGRARNKDEGTDVGSSIFDVPFGANLMVFPYGVGNDNTTFSVRVIGWRQVGDDVTGVWVPVVLVEVLCTLAMEAVGVAGKDVSDGEKFADTLSLTIGNNNVTTEVSSLGDGLISHFVTHLKGCEKVELSFSTGGSATSCNALIAMV